MIVETRSGRIEGTQREGLNVFLGIPFAAPPVGPRRFAAPAREASWSGVRAADAFGPSATQPPMMLPLPGMDVGEQDEDCLYLNVYAPADEGEPRPVMVWIHGGGFVIGSGSQPIYDAGPLARRGDVVVVTINYRLGPHGFMYLADLCPELEGAVGNAGMLDQIAALEWVQDNIAAFGGDPGNVTIFGESAGGMSVGTLMGMPAARPLFRRAIAQSGAAHNVHSRETATRVAEHFIEELGVPRADAARLLREIPPDKLVDTHRQTMLKLGTSLGLLPFQPLVDGDSLPAPPLDAVRGGGAAGKDFMTGTTRDEWKLFGMLDAAIATLDEAGVRERLAAQVGDEAVGALLGAYGAGADAPAWGELFFALETDRVFRIPAIRLAEAQLAHTDSVFMYRFDWSSPAMGGALGACHAVELPFVFGLLDAAGAELFTGSGPEANALAEQTMDAWLAFARTGDPSHPGLPGGRWDAYESGARKTMLLGRETGIDLDPDETRRRAWDDLL